MAGGGLPESKRASEMSHLLGVQVSPLQVETLSHHFLCILFL
jgi:hypothetical protein